MNCLQNVYGFGALKGSHSTIIFALCEPESDYIRYVGSTQNAWQCNDGVVSNSMSLQANRVNKIDQWLADLDSKGQYPSVVELERLNSRNELEDSLAFWRSYWKILGFMLFED